MAGADRVEGTLFGNGERTGNVCLVSLGLNLFSQGVDPQLDFSDIDAIRSTVEFAQPTSCRPRHPYGGDLVYTAFSGTHQDAIAKGFSALEEQATKAGETSNGIRWDVPYLPIDPQDVGRNFESVVRVNSQSGKGGIAHVLKSAYGLDLPRGLRVELGRMVQGEADDKSAELTSRDLLTIFTQEYLSPSPTRIRLKDVQVSVDTDLTELDAVIVDQEGQETRVTNAGRDPVTAYVGALAAHQHGVSAERVDVTRHPLGKNLGPGYVAYVELTVDGATWYGAAFAADEMSAELGAVTSATNRAAEQRTPSEQIPTTRGQRRNREMDFTFTESRKNPERDCFIYTAHSALDWVALEELRDRAEWELLGCPLPPLTRADAFTPHTTHLLILVEGEIVAAAELVSHLPRDLPIAQWSQLPYVRRPVQVRHCAVARPDATDRPLTGCPHGL